MGIVIVLNKVTGIELLGLTFLSGVFMNFSCLSSIMNNSVVIYDDVMAIIYYTVHIL